MDSRYYPGVEANVSKLIAELRPLFDEDYEIQTMNVSSTTVFQARKSSTLREMTGLSAALTIKITPEAGGTRVEIGMQKWFDKAAVAAIAIVLSAGLLIALPALGAYWQYKITEDAWKIIEDHIARKAGGYVPPLARTLRHLRRGQQRRLGLLFFLRRAACTPASPARPATPCRKILPRGSVIVAGNRWQLEGTQLHVRTAGSGARVNVRPTAQANTLHKALTR